MNSQLQFYLNLFIASQDPNLSTRTLYNKEYQALLFLKYLDSQDIHTLADFDVNVVYEFIASLDYSSQTISGFQFNIRGFFDVMHDNNITSLSGRTVFPVIFTNKRDRILSYYETHEVRSLINCIDVSAKNGVRDKCMVLLAAQTGLRARDILIFDLMRYFGTKISSARFSRKRSFLFLCRYLKISRYFSLIIYETTVQLQTKNMYSSAKRAALRTVHHFCMW